ncbi:MAG TPA: carbohydrate-binding family 9-like protein [Vicinamibacterales bacterium]|jgi:hypothetical protein
MKWVGAILSAALMSTAVSAADSYRVLATPHPRAALMAAGGEEWSPATAVSWGPVKYQTTFRALWSAEGLFLRFDATDDHPWFTMTRRDDHLWEEEVVEVFLDIDQSGRNYAELEISPGNVVCDVRMVQPYPDKQMDFDWNIEGLETRTLATPGRPPFAGDWTAVAFIPWPAFRSLPSAKGVALPPRPGSQWRFNLFRVKRPGGPLAPERGAVETAWSTPSQPSFHVPSAFQSFTFEAEPARRK